MLDIALSPINILHKIDIFSQLRSSFRHVTPSFSFEQRWPNSSLLTALYPPTLHDIDITSPVFFWKPDEGENGFLGQRLASEFTDPETHPDHVFTRAGQYMMYHKALLLVRRSPYLIQELEISAQYTRISNAPDIEEDLSEQVLAAKTPGLMKRLVSSNKAPMTGKQLSDWANIKFDVVVRANKCKFGQNEDLKQELMATGKRELVEASKYDAIWGIGYDAQHAQDNRKRWGKNMLGNDLMLVRQDMRGG